MSVVEETYELLTPDTAGAYIDARPGLAALVERRRVPRRDHPQHRRLRTRLPQCHNDLLKQNYRSTQNILTAANSVIARNTGPP